MIDPYHDHVDRVALEVARSFKTIRRATGKDLDRLERRLLALHERRLRAGPSAPDGFPSSASGGESGGNGGMSASTSVEAAVLATMEHRAGGDAFDRLIDSAVDQLGQWAASKGATENLVDRAEQITRPVDEVTHCQACSVGGVTHPWDHVVTVTVDAGLVQRVHMCEQARLFTRRLGRPPTPEEVSSHELGHGWRVRVDPKSHRMDAI